MIALLNNLARKWLRRWDEEQFEEMDLGPLLLTYISLTSNEVREHTSKDKMAIITHTCSNPKQTTVKSLIQDAQNLKT